MVRTLVYIGYSTIVLDIGIVYSKAQLVAAKHSSQQPKLVGGITYDNAVVWHQLDIVLYPGCDCDCVNLQGGYMTPDPWVGFLNPSTHIFRVCIIVTCY